MAFKLTKEELSRKQTLQTELSAGSDTLKDALTSYNAIIDKTMEFREGVENRLRDEFDAKSEKWQEGDAASAIAEMLDLWENFNVEEMELDFQHIDDFEALPDEP